MKNTKRLTRNQKIYLSKRGINEEDQRDLRFYMEIEGIPIFVNSEGTKLIYKKSEGLVEWVS